MRGCSFWFMFLGLFLHLFLMGLLFDCKVFLIPIKLSNPKCKSANWKTVEGMFKWVITILSLLSRTHKLKKDVNKNTYTVSVNFPWKTAWMRVLNGHESTTVPFLRYPQTWAGGGGGGGFCNKELLRIAKVVAKENDAYIWCRMWKLHRPSCRPGSWPDTSQSSCAVHAPLFPQPAFNRK